MNIQTIYGIKYQLPEVFLLQQTGIGTAEIAARTCYDSFDNSEHDFIKDFNPTAMLNNNDLVNNIEHSDLLDTLAWTHFHHSILEHANLTFLIKGTSRGVLQELARHRIASYSVRSTRYTMSKVIYAFVASLREYDPKIWFAEKIKSFDMFVTNGPSYTKIESDSIFDKLNFQISSIGSSEFIDLTISKSSQEFLDFGDANDVFAKLLNGKTKRNAGDFLKHVVSDNWKVDLVMTMNLRSLKNFLVLRDSGAAWFQIRWLAQEIKNITPKKYLDLIVKDIQK